jgi:hypothetical protein
MFSSNFTIFEKTKQSFAYIQVGRKFWPQLPQKNGENIIYGLCNIKQANQKQKLVNQRGGTLTLI